MYTHNSLCIVFAFFLPRKFLSKNLSFLFSLPRLLCGARRAHIKSDSTMNKTKGDVRRGRIEERFIIIFIAFQTEICELHRRENKNRSTMIRFLPITRLFPSLLSSCRRTGKSWREQTRRDNDMEEMNDCLRLNLMKNNMNNREGGWAVGESAASRCSMF